MRKNYINFLSLFILLVCGCQKENNGSFGNTWKTAAAMPTPRSNFGFVETGGLLYAIGGYNASGLNKVEVYDPSTDSWLTKADMPTPRGYLTVVTISNKIYAIGGITGSDLNNITYTNVTEEYDPVTDQWTEKSPFPISGTVNSVLGNQFIAGSSINGKIYIIAGSPGVTQPTFIYDPVTDTWETDTTIAIGKFNNQPYFSAGVNNGMFVTDGYDFLRYSIVDNNWYVLQPFSAHLGNTLASDGNNVYSIGGYLESSVGFTVTSDVGVYSISSSAWTKTSAMSNKRYSAAALIYNGNLYVAGGDSMQSSLQGIPLSSMEVLSVP
jgi:N-acetylneuraminic acid mutarotase